MATLNRVAWFFAVLLGILVGIVGFFVLFMSSFIGGLALMLIGASPIFLLMKVNKARANALEQELRRMADLLDGSGYVFVAGAGTVSGIALNATTQKIVLAEGKVRKVYDFEDIRSWETNHETPGTVIATGSAALTAASVNVREATLAARRSGLFITVRDIDHPKWRIALPQKEHARWMEILRQVVNQQ